MPVLDEASYLVKRAASSQATVSLTKSAPSAASGGSLKVPNGAVKPPPAPLADLLDLSSDDAPVTTSAPSTAPTDFLQDLLGIGLTDTSTAGFDSILFISHKFTSDASLLAQMKQVMLYHLSSDSGF